MMALKHFGIKARLIGLGLGVALMGALIVAVTLGSQWKATNARARLRQVESEGFRMA